MDDLGRKTHYFRKHPLWLLGPDLHLGPLDILDPWILIRVFSNPAGSTEAMTKEASWKPGSFPKRISPTNKRAMEKKNSLFRVYRGWKGMKYYPVIWRLSWTSITNITKDMVSRANLGETYRFQTLMFNIYEKIGFYLDLFSWWFLYGCYHGKSSWKSHHVAEDVLGLHQHLHSESKPKIEYPPWN